MFKYTLRQDDLKTTTSVSNEGFISRLTYTFASDEKIQSKIKSLLTKLNSIDDSWLRDKKINIKYYDAKYTSKMVKFMLTVGKFLYPIKQILDALERASDNLDEDSIKKYQEALFSTANKVASSWNIPASSEKADTKKTLSENGYTLSNLKEIVREFSTSEALSQKFHYEVLASISSSGELDVDVTQWYEDKYPNLSKFNEALSVYYWNHRTLTYFLYYLERIM